MITDDHCLIIPNITGADMWTECRLNLYKLLKTLIIICTNKCTHTIHTHTHTHTYIYIYTQIEKNYITNAHTCFGPSAPSSGSLYIVFV